MSKRRIFKLKTKTALNRVTAPSMPFTWSINPYRGCSHGCAFCYARNTHDFIGMGADDTFRTHIFVKEDSPEILRRELSRGKWKNGWVAVGTATDPYQPLEKQQQLTRRLLELLALYRVPVTVTTRSPLILRDIDLLQEISRHNHCSVNVSINTLDVKIWRSMEPESPHPEKRFETVQKLRQAGINAGIFAAPILPFLTDDVQVLDGLLHKASEVNAAFVMPSVLRLKPQVKPWFFSQLQANFPQLVSFYKSLYKGARADSAYQAKLHEKLDPLMDKWGFGPEQLRPEEWVYGEKKYDSGVMQQAPDKKEQLSLAL